MQVENTSHQHKWRYLPFLWVFVLMTCGKAATPSSDQPPDSAQSRTPQSRLTPRRLGDLETSGSRNHSERLLGDRSTGEGSEKQGIRFSGIPDSDKAKLSKLYSEVARYLQQKLGTSVEYVHVPDYTAAVTALVANKVDLVWLGGVTAVQAELRSGGKVQFLAAREEDLKFKSYLIAHRKLVDSGEFKAVSKRQSQPLSILAQMKAKFSKYSFTFGAKNSTSGHIMPRFFMQSDEVRMNLEQDFATPVTYQIQGGHQATLRAVANGSVDLGVLNYATWEAAEESLQASAPVVFVSPTYVDYCLLAHDRLGKTRLEHLRRAFVELDKNRVEHKKVLEAFSTQKFVRVDAQAWSGIRSAVEELTRKGVLQ